MSDNSSRHEQTNLQLFFLGLRAPGIKRSQAAPESSLEFDHSNAHPACKDPWLIEFLLNLNISIFFLRTAGLNLLNNPFAHLKTIIKIPFGHKHMKKCLTNEKKCLASPVIKEIQIKTTKCNFCLSIW